MDTSWPGDDEMQQLRQQHQRRKEQEQQQQQKQEQPEQIEEGNNEEGGSSCSCACCGSKIATPASNGGVDGDNATAVGDEAIGRLLSLPKELLSEVLGE